jgi:DNA-binding transcriptional LysR family regulator
MQSLRAFDANQLVVLDAVLRERSVRRAAASLHVTPSAVSHVLAELRRRLDDPLVVRQRGTLVPTPFALELEAPLRAGLDQLEAALSRKRGFDPATATASFALAATDLVELVVLPGLLARIAEVAPALQLRVVAPEADAFAQLDAGRADLVTGLFASAPAGYRFQALFEDGYALVVRKRHPLARGRVTAHRLAGAAHVIVDPRGSRNRTRVDIALAERGVSRRIVAAVPHFFAALHAIARSDLVGFLPTRIAATSEGVEILASPIAIPRFTVGQVWAERVQRDPAHRWFRDEVRAAARTAPVS